MTDTEFGTVVVTGGAGFIGCALSQLLAARAERWIAVDTLNPRIHPSVDRPVRLAESAELVVADITSPETWSALLADARPDIVIHLAAETDTGLSLSHVSRFSETNVHGTAVMLDAFAAHGIAPRHLLVASTRAVYGEGQWRHQDGSTFSPGQRTHAQLERSEWDFADAEPIAARAGTTPPAPTSIYGATKLGQETMLAAWAGGRDTTFTALRLQNVYGPGQSLINPYTGILPLFVQTIARGEVIDVYEDGRMTRDFVHITDVAAAFAAALRRPLDGRAVVADVGCGIASSLAEIAELISSVGDGQQPSVSGQFRDGDVRHAWSDVDASERTLGWRPRVTWRDGITEYARTLLSELDLAKDTA